MTDDRSKTRIKKKEAKKNNGSKRNNPSFLEFDRIAAHPKEDSLHHACDASNSKKTKKGMIFEHFSEEWERDHDAMGWET